MDAGSSMVLNEVAEAIELTRSGDSAAATETLLESFHRLRTILAREDIGWLRLFNGEDGVEFGLTLDDLKEWEAKISESVAGAPWIGRGFRMRHYYISKGGIQHGNIPKPTQGKKNIADVIARSGNQREFFGPDARRRREHRLYTSGVALWLVDAKDDITSIPLRQIKGQLLDPDGLGQIWAYLREWTRYDLRTGRSVEYRRWYFTDQFVDKRVPYIADSTGQRIPVEQGGVIVDQHANRIDGMAYGFPDALAAYIWNGIARDAYMDGRTMTKALAKFALKASVKSRAGAENAALQYATAETAGNLAISGAANDLTPLSTAGKGYDFTSIAPLVAVVAASLDIPKTTLMSDSAEGSFAGITSLDLPTRLAMSARRDEHIGVEKRILARLGLADADVQYKPFDGGDEVYRIIQGFMLGVQNDLYGLQEARDFVDNVLGLPNGFIPQGDERPSVLLAQGAGSASLPQTASPNQGRSNGTGGQRGGNASSDLRSDTVT